ncbi:xanthine dehydrogenase family protein molybdopterin-binding subunit [Halomonas salina]|uniref:Twin-arginine translocation pathway signal protein n=1 Tax=Halomonas salina TaxID=42565 RepID=A0ABR4WRG7_9GAMM|nr:molybdopterin cofactor-binding domain-containing protein [Halomonas salina]KGE76955.1 twin-arginine translocation pathway signal protein [Halomonas salina]
MSDTRDTLLLANVSRRHVLKGLAATGALVLAARWDLALGQEEEQQYGADAMPHGWVDNPNVFLHIAPDGTVTVVNHRAEMGQGIRTSLVMVAADELGADWERVRVEQAPGDEATYGNQNTDGSRSMRHWFDPMRRAAASARTMLEQAAAARWEVPAGECRAGVQVVVHAPSGRELGFGELAAAASQLPVPERDTLRLKSRDEWRYIGQLTGPTRELSGDAVDRPLAIDGEDIVQGRAVYGADVRRDDMLFAVIARPPVYGARLASVDDGAALEVPGVQRVVTVEGTGQPAGFQPLGGVAVVADNTWAAIEGRKALKLEWNLEPAGNNADYDSAAYRETLAAASRSPGKVIRDHGDIEAALGDAETRVEATYFMPHMAQAPMEPPVALAQVVDGHAEIWAPVQNPQAAREGVASRLGLPVENVTVHVTLLGGGFGRKSKPDYIFEAASLAGEFEGRPVRLQWTREDDIHHAYFHAVSLDRLEAGLDADGKAVGWRHRTLSPSIGSLFAEDPEHKQAFELGMGFNTLPFDIPAIRLENPEAEAHVRIGWFRSVFNLPHAFAIQSFAAELAEAAGRDHRDYLLELLGPARRIDPREIGESWNYGENPERYPIDVGRLRQVIETATAAAEWDRERPAGRGLGLAVHHSFLSYAAVVFDVEVGDGGELTIHSADIAFDCGPQVNPERIRAQMEGSCIMGIGIALQSEVTASDGRIEQDNFHQYQVPRMSNAPKETRVHLINDDPEVAMGGVGEPGLPPVAPALCNAIHAASGKRIRRLPVGNQLAS